MFGGEKIAKRSLPLEKNKSKENTSFVLYMLLFANTYRNINFISQKASNYTYRYLYSNNKNKNSSKGFQDVSFEGSEEGSQLCTYTVVARETKNGFLFLWIIRSELLNSSVAGLRDCLDW